MYFITGGAFNGKRAWVKQNYQTDGEICWFSAYQGDSIFQSFSDQKVNLLIFEGIELWIKELIERYETNQCLEVWETCIKKWILWEQSHPKRKLVIIGTDISKGIVPLEKDNRRWRDVTGWAYQNLAREAEKVEIIWYGINQTIK